MARLSQIQRLRAVGIVEAGLRQYDVAAHFGVTRATITRLLTAARNSLSSMGWWRLVYVIMTSLRALV